MKNLYIILFCFIFTSLFSQQIGIGTSWTYDSFSNFTPPNAPTTDKYTIIGEEEIGGKTYWVFENFNSCGPKASHLRIEDRNYYVIINGEENLLHNFNLLPGESYFIPDNIDNIGDSLEIIVDSIGITIIDGVSLNTQYCSFAEDILAIDWNLTFIEHVGSIGFMLPQFGACDPGAGNLRCVTYSDGVSLKFTADDKCEQYLGSSYFWKGSQWFFGKWGLPIVSEIAQIVIEKDSVTQFGEYKVMEILNQDNTPIEDSQILITSEGNKVYFLDQNGENQLLFDFSYNLDVGDTVTYYLPENANLYDISSNGGFEPIINPYRYVITDIDNDISVTSQTLRRWQVESIYEEVDGEIIGNWLSEIIEGIGPTGGFMRRGTSQVLSGEQEAFRCYFSNAFNYSEVPEGVCDILSNRSLSYDPKVTIAPNPVYDYLTVNSEIQHKTITLFDIHGNLIMTLGNETNLDLTGLTPGIYLLKFSFEKESINRKIVKL